ncbi:MAG: tRNA lysidine(34) synthetase TilS [Nocardioidaceae bacterium]
MTLDPALAAVRLAVRRTLADRAPMTGPVLVACSGGADSLALLTATVFETRAATRPVIGVTVDHRLQTGSAEHAAAVVEQMVRLGADETATVAVTVGGAGLGPEAAAREARYVALEELATRFGGSVILLGHTLDDQAETVLLGLTRGSGARSLAGMRAERPPFWRPLLGLTRRQTEAACLAEGIEFWKDPHNTNPRFTRARVRHRVLPVLEEELGPGVGAALARTAEQLQEDLAVLEALADEALREARTETGFATSVLETAAPAIRHRVLRGAAIAAGAPGTELFRVHVLALDALVMRYRGQQWVDLPGHLQGFREGGELRFRNTGERGAGSPVAG